MFSSTSLQPYPSLLMKRLAMRFERQWSVGSSRTLYQIKVVEEGACLPTCHSDVASDGGIVY